MLAMILLTAAGRAADAQDVDAHWKLEDLYATREAFDAARSEVEAQIASLGACEGHLGDDAATLLKCLDARAAVQKQLGWLSSYTSNHVSADTRDDAWRARDAKIEDLSTRAATATAWMGPELLSIGAERIEAMIAAEPKLQPYAYPLRATLRRGEHVKSPDEERILALATAVTARPGDIHSTFVNAELPWPTFTLPDGSTTKLTTAEYGRLRVHPDPAVRKAVFDAYFGALKGYEGTIGSMLSAQVSSHWFTAQARGYDSCVEQALSGDFIPREVYDTLVREANAALPTLHRYLKLRKELLGVDELSYSDLYVPIVSEETPRVFSLKDSEQLAIDSAKPLGKDYQAALTAAFGAGWIDAYPTEGKRSGAYMSDSAYGAHPFVLLNHVDDYDSASTLAHEMGHAMHSELAMSSQPFPTANYSTFLAEIASTFNEALLLEHQLKAAKKSDEDKLFYLGSALENLRTTYFRQAMFAEFELQIHEAVEQGEPLTGGQLTQMYADILKRYHGTDEGITRIDDVWTLEWSYIPHFYYDFYVYQYATSLAASSLLSQAVLDKKDKGAVDRYLTMLKAGGSDDPYVLLKTAGVDLASPEPYRAVAARMDAIMDQIEEIRAKQAKQAAKGKGK
ncbi:MAG: oligoendopeptidase F [Myxococcota bacterium]